MVFKWNFLSILIKMNWLQWQLETLSYHIICLFRAIQCTKYNLEARTVDYGLGHKGGFSLSRNFYVRTDVHFNWLYVRKLK